jgi:hypothetical protein
MTRYQMLEETIAKESFVARCNELGAEGWILPPEIVNEHAVIEENAGGRRQLIEARLCRFTRVVEEEEAPAPPAGPKPVPPPFKVVRGGAKK